MNPESTPPANIPTQQHTPPRSTPNPLYGESSAISVASPPATSPTVIPADPKDGAPLPHKQDQSPPTIPNAYQVFEDMYAKGPLEGDVGTVEWQAKFVRTALEDCLEEMHVQVHNDLQVFPPIGDLRHYILSFHSS